MTEGRTRGRLIALLLQRGHAGGFVDEMALALKVTNGHLAWVMTNALKDGEVGRHPEPTARAANRHRWFAPGFGPSVKPAAVFGRPRATAATVPCAAVVPAGFFTALVRQHNWPPQWQPSVDPPDPWRNNRVKAQACRAAGAGFSAGHATLGLEGAREHVARWQAKAAATIAGGVR